jgi:hypothetical protein
MTGRSRREARRAAAHAEFAAYPAPPTPGLWPCPRDPGVFRHYDGIGWTDWTREPAKQSDRLGQGSSRRRLPGSFRVWPAPAKPPEDISPPATPQPVARGRGSAIRQSQADRSELLHFVTDEDLQGLPEATVHDPDPEQPERGWLTDPAAPDIGQRRFYTGTEWTDLIAIGHWRLARVDYFRSTMEESRRRNELWLDERKHSEPELSLSEGTSVLVVLLTAVASSLLIAAPALPPGAGSDIAHSVGVILGLGVLFMLLVVAVNIIRSLPVEWRSSSLWVAYGLAIPAFVAFRGVRSVLSALGFN